MTAFLFTISETTPDQEAIMNPEQLGQKLAELLRRWGLLPAKPALRPIPVRSSRPRRSSSRR